MRVMNHNWSATKQRLHRNSVAEISRHSVLSGDRIRQCGTVAAFLRRAGDSMLESTGSHGRGVERRVPEMRRMVEFNCTPT